MSSEIITRTVGPNAAKRALREAFKVKRPVFLWGPPGVGKSDIAKQLADEMDALFIDIRLSLWEPTDIKGIPYFSADTNVMKWAPPIELPSAELASQYDTVILFLDEMNSAAPSVQAAAYQLVLNRRVGTYVLPDNVLIIAAGNRETDRGVTNRMPKPLANRFTHLEMKVDWNDYFEWATENKIHSDILGYLSYAKKDLYDFDPKADTRAFATPRSWTYVSDFFYHTTDESTLTDLVAGSIGEGLAVKLMAHRKHSANCPLPIEVLEGKVKKLQTKEISAMYSLIIGMCYELLEQSSIDSKTWHKYCNNFLQFSMDNFETELVIMGIRLALTQYNLTFHMDEIECFDTFNNRYGKYIAKVNER
jgi:MoxR-like ATPase